MLLHDSGMHLYTAIILLAFTFPVIEAMGKAADDAVREHKRRLDDE